MMGIVVLCAVAGAGCATMFTGSAQQVTVSSQPPGARVFVNGGYSGVTPVSLLLRTERDYTVTLQREGFRDATAPLVREFNPVAALNLFGLVCWVVDLATGALWRLTPTTVYATLQPAGPPSGYQPPPGAGWGPPPGFPVPSEPPGAAPGTPASPGAPYGAPPPAYPPPPPPGYPPPPPASGPPPAAPH
jgi:hypothetical protein